MIEFDLAGIVLGFGNDFVIRFVKRLSETAEKFAHGDIYHRVAEIDSGVNQVGRSVGGNKVISAPQIAVDD